MTEDNKDFFHHFIIFLILSISFILTIYGLFFNKPEYIPGPHRYSQDYYDY